MKFETEIIVQQSYTFIIETEDEDEAYDKIEEFGNNGDFSSLKYEPFVKNYSFEPEADINVHLKENEEKE